MPACPAVRHLRPAIRAMHGYTPGEQVVGCTKLNTNESAVPPSPAVLAALAALEDDRLRLYPDPRANALRRVAAERYGVTVDHLLVGNGSDDCLTVLYRAFLAPGERVAVPWPTYGLYDDLATLQGSEIVHVDYRITANDWLLPDSLARQGAKLTIVANPNNPSGTLVPVAELRRLADQVEGILVVDEAYVDFAGSDDDGTGASLIAHLDAHPNLVILRTFSKSYSLAGARLGLLFAHPELVAHLMKVKDSYNVNHLSQAAGLAALEDRAHHRQLIAVTLAERARLETGLAALGWTWPRSAANFLLCEVGPRAKEILDALKARGLLVRWWNRPDLVTKLRITVGNRADNDRLLVALREIAG